MKKLIFGLLIIAAGAGVYYVLKYNRPKNTNSIDKELLAGQWKLDSLASLSKDSSLHLFLWTITHSESSPLKQRIDFLDNGRVIQLKDSAKADTAYYEWTRKNDLVWKENASDSTGEIYSIAKLNVDSLVLQSGDSVRLVFTKIK